MNNNTIPPPLPPDSDERWAFNHFGDMPGQTGKVKKRKKKWLLILLLCLGIPLLAILCFVGIGMLYLMTAKELPTTPADRAVIIDAQELAEWLEDYEPDSRHETFTKVRYMDKSYELELR